MIEQSVLTGAAYIIGVLVMGMVRLFPFVVALVALEHFFGRSRRAWKTDATRTDIGFIILSWFYAPLVRYFLTLLVAIAALPSDWLYPRDSGVSGWPPLVQAIVFLLLRDILIFARHRIFHSRQLWPFHAIHHSSKELTWLSTARFHPAESILETTLDIILAVLVPIDIATFQIVALLIGFNNFLVHSNCNFTYGPLRWILVSPVFHRWHHSVEPAARNKNFAAMFSFLDLIYGSFYLPSDKYPTETGITGPRQVPETLMGQLTYPFIRHD